MKYQQESIKPYSNEGAKGEQVERMFDQIAHSYDFLNHTLSLGIDRSWRKAAIDSLKPYAPQRILDVATGTGDFALMAAERLQPLSLVGADLSEGMLNVGREKVERAGKSDIITMQKEDCMALSFADNTFDLVFHNGAINFFNDKACAMNEMLRVAKPGSKILVADETADFVESQYKKSIFSKSYFEGKTVDLHEMEQCVPPQAEEKRTELFWNNRFYGITFRKSRG